jgi:hypothetical protein
LEKKERFVMNSEEIIEMARQAAAVYGHTFKEIPSPETVEFITAFYKLVAAKEREACAKVCESEWGKGYRDDGSDAWLAHDNAVYACASAIRARGEQA